MIFSTTKKELDRFAEKVHFTVVAISFSKLMIILMIRIKNRKKN